MCCLVRWPRNTELAGRAYDYRYDMEQWSSWSCMWWIRCHRVYDAFGGWPLEHRVDEQTYADAVGGKRLPSALISAHSNFDRSSAAPSVCTPETITIFQKRLRHFESNESFLHNKESILICSKLKLNNTITFNQANKIRATKIQSSSATVSQWAEK